MDENYPIVRFTSASGNVYYATTSNWRMMRDQVFGFLGMSNARIPRRQAKPATP